MNEFWKQIKRLLIFASVFFMFIGMTTDMGREFALQTMVVALWLAVLGK